MEDGRMLEGDAGELAFKRGWERKLLNFCSVVGSGWVMRRELFESNCRVNIKTVSFAHLLELLFVILFVEVVCIHAKTAITLIWGLPI
jgi:hypothetical protein